MSTQRKTGRNLMLNDFIEQCFIERENSVRSMLGGGRGRPKKRCNSGMFKTKNQVANDFASDQRQNQLAHVFEDLSVNSVVHVEENIAANNRPIHEPSDNDINVAEIISDCCVDEDTDVSCSTIKRKKIKHVGIVEKKRRKKESILSSYKNLDATGLTENFPASSIMAILESSFVNEADVICLNDPQMEMCQLTVAAYLAYLCQIDPQRQTVAIHPEFSNNLANRNLEPVNYLLNPKNVPYESVKIVLIPLLLIGHFNAEKNVVDLTKKVGHFVLGVYNVSLKCISYFDPYGNRSSSNIDEMLKSIVVSLPTPISSENVKILQKNPENFNIQSDGINCGFYVCLFSEMSVIYPDKSNIKINNFDIAMYRQTVTKRLEQLVISKSFPSFECLILNHEDLHLEQQIPSQNELNILNSSSDENSVCDQSETLLSNNIIYHPKKVFKTREACQKRHPGKFCASKSANHTNVEYYSSGGFDYECKHCKALLLKREYKSQASKCCHFGKVDLLDEFKILQNPPAEILDLANTNGSPLCQEFRKHSRTYNTEFAFGSMHTESLDPPTRGPPICRINGEISYELSDLYPNENKPPMFGQCYTLEPEVSKNMRIQKQNYRDIELNPTIVSMLEDCIRENNALAKVYKWAHELYEAEVLRRADSNEQVPLFRLYILTNREARKYNIADRSIHLHQTEVPTAKQVGVIWINSEGEPPKLGGVTLTGKKGNRKQIHYFSPSVDPATFPLLFPYGQQGYRFGIPLKNPEIIRESRQNKNVICEDEDFGMCVDFDDNDYRPDGVLSENRRTFASSRQYYRYLMQMRPSVRGDDFHWLWNTGPLSQVFTISTLNKIERHDMDYLDEVQGEGNLRSVIPESLKAGLEKGLKPGETLGKVKFAPVTWPGSRRYMQQAYADAKAMTRHLGNPTFFVTLTGNPQAPEIVDNLLPGQTYADRPDLVVRVFNDMLCELMEDITKRHVLGPCSGYAYSIEHQKRGMPHAHILVFLEKNDEHKSERFVDEFISAEIPDKPTNYDEMSTKQKKEHLYYWVTKLNLHDCGEGYACFVEGKCTKHFPKKFSHVTVIKPDTFPIYKREAPPVGNVYMKKVRQANLEIDNSRVVPYNSFLTMKYRAHINLEHVAGQQCIDYVFKYIFKGHDMAYVRLEGDNMVVDYDEIKHCFKVRYMSSPEAMWRMLGLRIVKLSHTVGRQWVYGPKGVPVTVREGYEQEADPVTAQKKNMVQAFFELCKVDDLAAQLTYDQVGCYFTFNKTEGRWQRRKKAKPEDIIVRVGSVSPINQELFCLRVLLFNVKGPISYENIRTVPGIEEPCKTFEETARLRGLLQSDDIWKMTLTDARNELKSSRRFLRFFALVLFHCMPEAPNLLFEEWYPQLGPQNMTDEEKKQYALRHLEYYLVQWNSSCEKMGLPVPISFDYDRFEQYLESTESMPRNVADDYEKPQQFDWSAVVDRNYAKFNIEQKIIFDKITSAALAAENEQGQRLFFVHGAGGTGKTFLYNTIIAWAIFQNKLVLPCASTGIAALLLTRGATAHSTFAIQNDIGPNHQPTIAFESRMGKRLRDACIIIIDEVSMLSRHILAYIDKVLRSVQNRNEESKLFGGKVVLLSGDFKQLMPVAGNSQIDQLLASIRHSEYFPMFEKLFLFQNMRVAHEEIEFSIFLNELGYGKNLINGDQVVLPNRYFVSSRDELIEFCFPSELMSAPIENISQIRESCILAVKNESVFGLNERILNALPGDTKTFLSVDTLGVRGGEEDPLECLSVSVGDNILENIHRKTPTGLPPHILKLKLGCIVMLIRNVSIPRGLCNGTRLQVIRIEERLLTCRVITGSPEQVANRPLFVIPKMTFKHGTGPESRSTPFTRVQFPVRLAFAITVNKAQGQTLNRVGLALDSEQVFSHGQLYVALSRVRTFDGIRVLAPRNRPNPTQIRNIVETKVLL